MKETGCLKFLIVSNHANGVVLTQIIKRQYKVVILDNGCFKL